MCVFDHIVTFRSAYTEFLFRSSRLPIYQELRDMRCDKAAQPSVFPGLLDRIVHAGSDRRSEIVRLMTVITISTGAAARFEDDTHPQPSDVVRRSQVLIFRFHFWAKVFSQSSK